MKANYNRGQFISEDFMRALEVVSGITMSSTTAFKFFKMQVAAFKIIEETSKLREEILIKHCVKNNEGKPKMKGNEYRFKDMDSVKDAVVKLLSEKVEVETDFTSDDIVSIGVAPKVIPAIGVISFLFND